MRRLAGGIGDEEFRKFLSDSALSTAALVISGALSMATGIVLARWLGPRGFGVYSVVLALLTFAGALGTVGFDYTASRFVSYYAGSGEAALVRMVIVYAVKRAAFFSLCVTAVVFAGFRSGLAAHCELWVVAPYMPGLLIAIPALAAQSVLFHAILGLHAVVARVALEKIALPGLRLIAPFALVMLCAGKIEAAVNSLFVTAVLIMVAAALVLRKYASPLPASGAPPTAEKRRWASFALPNAFFSVQVFVSSGMGIDVLMVSALKSVVDSGVYSACFRFTLVLVLARAGMDYAFGPRVGRLFGGGDLAGVGDIYRLSSAVGLGWTLPCAVAVMLFSGDLMSLSFGPPYARGSIALAVLAIGFAIDGAAGCNTTLLSMIGRPWLVLANGLTGGVLSVALCFVLIPCYGMVGAAVAVTVARSMAAVMGTYEIWRLHHIHPFTRSSAKLLVAAALAAAFGYALGRGVDFQGDRGLVLLAGVIVAVFLCYAAVLGVTKFSIGPAEA
jgi:O-antigen/teichoic acid export membrane protein